MPLQIGRMRQRVTLQQPTLTQNSYGEPVAAWSDVQELWASILPASGMERYVSGGEQLQAGVTHRVRMRYRSDVSPIMRLLWGTRTLEIDSIQDPSGKTSEMVLMCSEVLPNPTGVPATVYSFDLSDGDNSFYLGLL